MSKFQSIYQKSETAIEAGKATIVSEEETDRRLEEIKQERRLKNIRRYLKERASR